MRRTLLAALTVVALAGPARSDEAPPKDAIPLGSDDCRHTFARAGYYPGEVSRCAAPSNGPDDGGYYVGGGCPVFGGPPGPLQGTYGWDYIGHHPLYHCVVLGWCHCRYKGGTGAYAVDTCPVPDVFKFSLPPHAPCAGDP
jgi:hypothetical protein